MSIDKNLHHILSEIEKTKRGNNLAQSVTLVAATKTQPFHLIQNLYSLGVSHIGENRIQEAASKFESFANMPNITRRFIGHLQSNKINKFMNLFDTIDSIDSYKLANKINTKG
jgi:Predicted enzyme with a TIM-barrel fold